jgi:hypothetical protein
LYIFFFQKKKYFFFTFFYATFQCGRYGVFKKNLTFFFDPEKVKKPPSKVAHNRPKPFFPLASPDHSPQPRIDFSYYEILGPDICSLICELEMDGTLHTDFRKSETSRDIKKYCTGASIAS